MASASPYEPSPLGEAAKGFAGLATWFTGVAGEHMVSVARTLDRRRVDADTVASLVARSAALPLLGWAALANELLETATFITEPLLSERDLESDIFHASGRVHRAVSIDGPETLINGFGSPLLAASVVPIHPSDREAKPLARERQRPTGPLLLTPHDSQFTLLAEAVQPECFGVYKGQATMTVAEPGQRSASDGRKVDVWLVVP